MPSFTQVITTNTTQNIIDSPLCNTITNKKNTKAGLTQTNHKKKNNSRSWQKGYDN